MTPGSFSNKLHASILVAVIAAMSTALYLSPTGKSVRSDIKDALPFGGDKSRAQPATPSKEPSPQPSNAAFATPKKSTTSTPASSSGPKIEGCWSFTYQQDAQAYYVKDISDPLGLDGPKGPENGDGLACTQLPVDPKRSASKAVGAYVVPIASKAELVNPEKKYFGVAEDGLPGDSGLMDKLTTQVGKAPSMVEWFSSWDESYAAAKVDQAWNRGALPVITWMPAHKGNKDPADTSLQRIVDGDWDTYITEYAQAVAKDGKPVVLRFAHEQNGNWYPWSAGGNRSFERGATDEPFHNTPALFKEAWKHVWTIFQETGANKQAIWTWTPVRIDDIKPNLTDKTKTSYGLTAIEDSYPGDAYVDWVGMSGYSYKGTEWSYATTFAKTLDALKSLAPTKRIFIAETGASENSGDQSNLYRKPLWIADTLNGLGTDSKVLGFVWFNNTVVDVHTVDGVTITTDNKWDTSADSLAAFIKGIADPIWMSGTASDTVTTK
jgi:hypothetical protein